MIMMVVMIVICCFLVLKTNYSKLVLMEAVTQFRVFAMFEFRLCSFCLRTRHCLQISNLQMVVLRVVTQHPLALQFPDKADTVSKVLNGFFADLISMNTKTITTKEIRGQQHCIFSNLRHSTQQHDTENSGRMYKHFAATLKPRACQCTVKPMWCPSHQH